MLVLHLLTPLPAALKTAIKNTAIAVSAAMAFGAGLYTLQGPQSGFEFLTGYVVEQSLSVDNLFVFILLFQVRIGSGESGSPSLGCGCR